MMMTTVIDVFALLPDLIECKYPRPPIADACALVVNTLIKYYYMLLRAQQVTNNNGLLSPMRARR